MGGRKFTNMFQSVHKFFLYTILHCPHSLQSVIIFEADIIFKVTSWCHFREQRATVSVEAPEWSSALFV